MFAGYRRREAPAHQKDLTGTPPQARHGGRRIFTISSVFPARPGCAQLSALFSLDAFAGAFILQSIVAYWFHAGTGLTRALGGIFFGGNILAGISALSASWLARRIGLITRWCHAFPRTFFNSRAG